MASPPVAGMRAAARGLRAAEGALDPPAQECPVAGGVFGAIPSKTKRRSVSPWKSNLS